MAEFYYDVRQKNGQIFNCRPHSDTGGAAILVAVAIPTFTSQLEKAREATDLANIRSVYAEVMAAALNGDTSGTTDANGVACAADSYKKTVTLIQTANHWTTRNVEKVGGVDISSLVADVTKKTITIEYVPSTLKTTITAG